ncbi:pentatricopeptide repeat-containing protein At2g39620 [Tripterygium wilfordii]|uniref:pentatricopeptide repeat-containing protein At2g39620 n=1 Tax=Tripterygium wilfordii TaxID=458696 RepID=UPI0018F846A4|nr:pentatricopeptide repeat-containing protein At2g39620 [Tripterygium wilfordii]XP_038679342.1 pentatricopeptide repeat-containing protein At2g39620 [Tripterygium wilfordii]
MSSKHVLQPRFFHALSTCSVNPSPFVNKPDLFSYPLRLLYKCRDLKSLLQIHGLLVVSGHKQDYAITTHLMNSQSSTNPTVFLYNSIIRAYTNEKKHEEALKMYHVMLKEGFQPDKYTFTFAVKACTGALDLQEGVLIHENISRRGLECDVFIGTGLVDMYGKLGDLGSSRKVFDKMPKRDVAAWNVMIAGLSQNADPLEALGYFKCMQQCDILPDSMSLMNLIPAVSRLADVDICRFLHCFVIKKGFNEVLSDGLIDMYSKCQDVDAARQVFDRQRRNKDVSWGTMMAGYAHNGYFIEVLELFDCMKREKIKMKKASLVSSLLAASELRDISKGKNIHECAIEQGITLDVSVVTPIITMFATCGELEKAKALLWGLQERDLVTWSAIIAASVQSGYPGEALSLFRDMQSEHCKPNEITIRSILPACTELSSLRLGKSVHCYAVKVNLDYDTSTLTALVSMYAKCGSFTEAVVLFNRMPCKDVVAWTVLINGYVQMGDPYNAIDIFRKLSLSEVRPDRGTMVALLPACTLLHDLNLGSCVHALILKCGFDFDSHVKNALLDMYVKCGSISSAEFMFNFTEFKKDEISWNTMIAGYLLSGLAKYAISAFHQMKSENVWPNAVTMVSVLPAVAYLAALGEGMVVHACIFRFGFQATRVVGNSLIDMYAKCGRVDYSEKCFDELKNKDTVSWNAMIAGYAIHGQGDSAIALFSLMQENQVGVNPVSFLSVLCACKHAGLIEEGKEVFDSMCRKHHLIPDLEHYACMVDLLGRSGLFDEIMDLIKGMPMEPDAGVWGALLGACRMHSNVHLAEVALSYLVKHEPGNPAHYVVLSSIYAHSGRWDDAWKTKLRLNDMGLKKSPGCSWVEVNNRVHAFRVGDQSHPQFESMCTLWNTLLDKMEKIGYVPDRSCVLHDVEEEDKEIFLYNHSERLAITFALLNTEAGSTIHIVKNLRACVDCHTATKFITKVTKRKITVRDATRFHHFKDGICSCKDYW